MRPKFQTLAPIPKTHRRMGYDHRITLTSLLGGMPGVSLALILLWYGGYSPRVQWTLSILLAGAFIISLYVLRERIVYPLQTLANILAGLRDEDYSIRARGARPDDALGEVMIEVNALGESLREQRLGALEATALVKTVMAEIDLAVFTFDNEQRLRLVNRAAEKLMAQPSERLLGRTAGELGLVDCLQGEASRTIQRSFPGGLGRWGVRRSNFRQGGLPHQLLVLSDLSRALREEERQAWQRILRVLGHELNNSLAPIKSIAGSMESLLKRSPRPSDWESDMQRGLQIISGRAESLNRFMEAYTRIARLPPPKLQPIQLKNLMERVVAVETRLQVEVRGGPDLEVTADPDQLEQLLINLVRNAADAALQTAGGVQVSWTHSPSHYAVLIQDSGPGLSNTANLFVPFFTTKPGGSGIGLVLCRQIAEAHGGVLTLENRPAGQGCEARLSLPLGK